MTDYSALPAREIDALVARELFNAVDRADWIRRDCPSGEMVEVDGEFWIAERVRSATTPFRPSTDGSAMLAVLDALRGRELVWAAKALSVGVSFRVFETGGRRLSAVEAATLPRAVAEAALAAVGGK